MIKLGIIGAGEIATKHLEVINKISGFKVSAISSRSINKAYNLQKKFNINNVFNDTDTMIKDKSIDAYLVLVSPENNFKIAKKLIQKNKIFFIEKPPALNFRDMSELSNLCNKFKSKNMVGLNRRYYSIFEKGLKLILNKGDLLGVAIEGHERFWNVIKTKNNLIKNHWKYVNSIHTVDLLRFFGGKIIKGHYLKNSVTEKNGDQFYSIFQFKSKALGSYIANWHSPGGWSVKLFGEGITVEFKPLEEGRSYDKNNRITLIKPSKEDLKFKPGFFKQMLKFKELVKTNKKIDEISDINDCLKTYKILNKMK